MTENKEELLEILGNLRGLSKKKKYRLARPEHDEAIKTLSSVCLLGLDGIQKILEALSDFPSDTGAEAVDGNWDKISAHMEEFYKSLEGTKYKTELGKRLRLLIGQRLSSKAPEVASRVILGVCKDMQPAKKEFPTSKDLHSINSTLLANGISVLVRLPLDEEPRYRAVQLVSYCLAAGFSLKSNGKSLATPQTQLALIRWANEQSKFLKPGKEIQGLISARILDWNNDLLKLLRSELDSLHPSLRDPINSALEKSTGVQSQVGSEVTAAVVSKQADGDYAKDADEPAQIQPSPSRDSGATYDALAELEHLSNHIKQMYMVLHRGQEDVDRLERDLRQAEIELKGSRQENDEAKRRCSVVKAELADSLTQGKKLEQIANSHQDQIVNLKSQLIDMENHHKGMLEAHRAEVDHLSKRIAQEGEHRLDGFRHRLAGMLRPIVMDMKDAHRMEMTLALGTAVRNQLKQLLKMLQSQGVPLDGDDV